MDEFGKRLEPFIVPAVVALVGLTCFGLGRLSVIGGVAPRLVISQGVQTAAVENAPAPSAHAPEGRDTFVASKSGTKYYLPSCSGAARIKEENKVWFSSAGEAAAAGYEPAANCPGL
jgi:hypothetical protein